MYRKVIYSIILAGVLAGCGGHVTNDPTSAALMPRRVTSDETGMNVDLPVESMTHTRQMNGTPQSVFPLVAEAYEELGITVETMEPAHFVLGNRSFKARQRIAGTPMSRIVECGLGPVGPRANTDMITFSILTQVQPGKEAGRVRVETIVTATAQSVEGGSVRPTACASLGELEKRIAEAVERRVGN